jgi:hypothetical protein
MYWSLWILGNFIFLYPIIFFLFQANTESSLNRDKGSKMHEEKKTQATTAGSRATTPYVSQHAEISWKTAESCPLHTAPDKAAPERDVTKGPLMTNKQDQDLETHFLAKQKKIYAMRTESLKKQVRITKSVPGFHIMHSVYEVREITCFIS